MMERPDERGDDESPPSERGKLRGAGSRPQSEFARVAHVLVVDDDPAMRAMIADYLTDQNMRVSVATDSREMQRVLAADGVDLVVLDLKLGNEDGLAIVRALRADPVFRSSCSPAIAARRWTGWSAWSSAPTTI